MTPALKTRLYQGTLAVLLLVIAAMTYKFVVVGSTEGAADGRTTIVLTPPERALVLREMRGFVSGLQAISDALSRDDMQGVAKAAQVMGMARSHDVPIALVGKLPLEFKTLAFGVHRDFDAIATDAANLGTPSRSLAQLSGALAKCVACHDSFQLRATTADSSPKQTDAGAHGRISEPRS